MINRLILVTMLLTPMMASAQVRTAGGALPATDTARHASSPASVLRGRHVDAREPAKPTSARRTPASAATPSGRSQPNKPQPHAVKGH